MVSTDKIHACDSPGCGKTFYERCTMLRHQSLKHGRKAKYSRSSEDAIGSYREYAIAIESEAGDSLT